MILGEIFLINTAASQQSAQKINFWHFAFDLREFLLILQKN